MLLIAGIIDKLTYYREFFIALSLCLDVQYNYISFFFCWNWLLPVALHAWMLIMAAKTIEVYVLIYTKFPYRYTEYY